RRRAPSTFRISVLDRLVYRDDAFIGLVFDFLFRFGRRQRRLPDGERDLSHGDSRHGDRLFLHGGAGGRHRRALAVWPDDRNLGDERVLRVPVGGRVDARGGGGGTRPGRQ